MPFRVAVFPHNDLMNLAWHHLSTVEEKLKSGRQDGITLDCLSCLFTLGVAVEALVNFVGQRSIDQWPQQQNFPQKLQHLVNALQLPFDKSVDPLSTINIIRKIRNEMAHSRPMEFHSTAQSRAELRAAMAAPWDAHAHPEFARNAMAQVRLFRNQLFVAAKIPASRTFTTAIGGM